MIDQTKIHDGWLSKSAETRQAKALDHARHLAALLTKDMHEGEIASWPLHQFTLKNVTARLTVLGVLARRGGELTETGLMRALSYVSRTWQSYKFLHLHGRWFDRTAKAYRLQKYGSELQAVNEFQHAKRIDKYVERDTLCRQWFHFSKSLRKNGIKNVNFRDFLKIRHKISGHRFFNVKFDLSIEHFRAPLKGGAV
jgi:hypothetical protein